jgi:hypothetical protein
VVYARVIRRLDREIKGNRALLLLIPDEVSHVVPSVARAGLELLNDATSAGSSGGGRSAGVMVTAH